MCVAKAGAEFWSRRVRHLSGSQVSPRPARLAIQSTYAPWNILLTTPLRPHAGPAPVGDFAAVALLLHAPSQPAAAALCVTSFDPDLLSLPEDAVGDASQCHWELRAADNREPGGGGSRGGTGCGQQLLVLSTGGGAALQLACIASNDAAASCLGLCLGLELEQQVRRRRAARCTCAVLWQQHGPLGWWGRDGCE
jgi:hypothetical protein